VTSSTELEKTIYTEPKGRTDLGAVTRGVGDDVGVNDKQASLGAGNIVGHYAYFRDIVGQVGNEKTSSEPNKTSRDRLQSQSVFHHLTQMKSMHKLTGLNPNNILPWLWGSNNRRRGRCGDARTAGSLKNPYYTITKEYRHLQSLGEDLAKTTIP
jgi:hypothetical protein